VNFKPNKKLCSYTYVRNPVWIETTVSLIVYTVYMSYSDT